MHWLPLEGQHHYFWSDLLMADTSHRALFSLDEFCLGHGISRGLFYKLQRQGRAPAVIKLGARTMISAESAAAWRQRMQDETRPLASAG
jgi:predicted DNA-binding transcriptional regulator AlpA